MILVDTSVWINHWRGTVTAAVARLRALGPFDGIVTGDLVLFEALAGARDEGHAERLRSALMAFDLVSILNRETAVTAARHDRALRAAGVTPRRMTDLWIATWCIEQGATLLHDDRDFLVLADHLPLKMVAP